MSDLVWTPSSRGEPGKTPRDLAFGQLTQYCKSLNGVERRKTRTCQAGPVKFGSEHPIVRQTMATTLTSDVQATVDQTIRCADEGFDLVRITVVGMKDAKACVEIRKELDARGYSIPLCADMHFQPKVALVVADAVEKIRVNPGNFADGRKSFEEVLYETDEEYFAERAYIEETFTPLVLKCKELNRMIRIGTNHGSLSARTLSFYGDTPRGMVEAAIEFADICRQNDFHNFVFSMKASNPLVMVQAYRLLAAEQYRLGWDYPLHLGVTEAGEGEDGRMKSAIGIAGLLNDGLGDTIRVSLTEEPEAEHAPCNRLAEIGSAMLDAPARAAQAAVPAYTDERDIYSFERREVTLPGQQEGDALDYRGLLNRDGSVISVVTAADLANDQQLYADLGCKTVVGLPFKDISTSDTLLLRVPPALDDTKARQTLATLASIEHAFVLLDPPASLSRIHASRRVFSVFNKHGIDSPVIHHFHAPPSSSSELALQLGTQAGGLLCDGLGNGILVEPDEGATFEASLVRTTSFGLLQGSRMRSIKTEFVSCPSCGRTLFDLQEVTAQISERTGHLPGVTIAIMGCIVNGPGEMADADFGYVGGAPGKVDLYVGKEVVRRAIPNEDACDALIELIKDNGMWEDKEEAGEGEEEGAAAEAVAA